MSNSTSTMRCRVRQSKEGWEGTVFMYGLRPTKLVKKDDTCVYANRNGVASAAKALADRFGLSLEVEDTGSGSSTGKKKAASSSTKKSAFAASTPSQMGDGTF